MVLDQSDIAYRYPTPTESPPPKTTNHTVPPISVAKPKALQPVVNHPNGVSTTPTSSSSLKPSVILQCKPSQPEPQKQIPIIASNGGQVQNQAAFQQNGAVVMQKEPTILIPASQLSSQRSEWQEFPDIDRRIAAGVRKQKRKRDVEDDGRVDLQVDQRKKADAALQGLENTLDDIFEAEEQPGTSSYSVHFVQSAYSQADTPILARHAQERMESAIKKAVDSKRFQEMDMDQLIRAEKLCGSTASCIEALELSIGEDAEAGEVQEWIERLELAENGLRGGKVLLRIMTAGREETQLYSEDILTTLLRSVEQVIDTLIIPVTVARSKESGTKFKKYSSNRKVLDPIVITCGRVLRLLGDLISKVDVADMVVHKVESLASKLIFVDNAHTEKDSALGTQRFEAFRRTAMDCLAKIYARHPSHRADIINGVLSSLGELPVTRQGVRQYKLPEGKPIQLVSALLMRLVQSSGARSTGNSRKSQPVDATADVDADADADMDEDDSSSETPPPKKQPTSGNLVVEEVMNMEDAAGDLRKLADPLQNSAFTDANYIINWIVNRALSSTKTGDDPYRNLLEIFTADFLSVLGLPDWPSAETLLTTLLVRVVEITKEEKQSANAKSLGLELMGMMGAGITDLNIYIRKACEIPNTSQSHLTAELVEVANMLSNASRNPDQERVQELNSFRGPYRVVIEYLQSQGLHNLQTQSAHGYILTRWSKAVLKQIKDNEVVMPADLCLRLRNMMVDANWLRTNL
jgi:cohesin loading factor subunit SCC2